MKVSEKAAAAYTGILTPPGVEPGNIDKIVLISIYQRVSEGNENLVMGTLAQYIGTLKSYALGVNNNQAHISFWLDGVAQERVVNLKTHFLKMHRFEQKVN